MAADIEVIWVRRERKYFFRQDWTGQIRLIRFNKSSFRRIAREALNRSFRGHRRRVRANRGPVGGFRNDKGGHPSADKNSNPFPREGKRPLAIVGIMLRGLRRPEHDEFRAFLFDQRRKFLAVVRRHMPRAAVRTVVVAHAGPLIGPYPPAAGASVEVEKPGHASLLGSQTIISPRDEINKSAIAQILKLLAYLGFDVLIAGIKIAEMPLEGVDLVQREVAF